MTAARPRLVIAFVRKRGGVRETPQIGAAVTLTASIDRRFIPGPDNPAQPFVDFTTKNDRSRVVDTGCSLQALEFVRPVEKTVRHADLPAKMRLGWGNGKLIVRSFTEKGFVVEERRTAGCDVRVNIYCAPDAASASTAPPPQGPPPFTVEVPSTESEWGLTVTNHGNKNEFTAKVVEVQGCSGTTEVPWNIKWDDWGSETRPILTGDTQMLDLVKVHHIAGVIALSGQQGGPILEFMTPEGKIPLGMETLLSEDDLYFRTVLARVHVSTHSPEGIMERNIRIGLDRQPAGWPRVAVYEPDQDPYFGVYLDPPDNSQDAARIFRAVVVNEGPKREFWARVTRMEGHAGNVVMPSPVRWTNAEGESREILAGAMERLELCRFLWREIPAAGPPPVPLFEFPGPNRDKRVRLNITPEEIAQSDQLYNRELVLWLEVRTQDQVPAPKVVRIQFDPAGPHAHIIE